MTPPGTFDRVYATIRQRLRDGLYRPGERLEPAVLSDELNASVTPVRDALHRLAGERLVEAPRHEGFRAPMMTENMLRHLYIWHLDLVMLALMKHRAAPAVDEAVVNEGQTGRPVHDRQNSLFLALARSAGNPEQVAALESETQRLEPIQRLEQLFLDETEAETKTIVEALRARDRKALRSALVRYHRRRLRIIPDLLTSLLER
jgi:DNA-binding GntR family transcriptional regulator